MNSALPSQVQNARKGPVASIQPLQGQIQHIPRRSFQQASMPQLMTPCKLQPRQSFGGLAQNPSEGKLQMAQLQRVSSENRIMTPSAVAKQPIYIIQMPPSSAQKLSFTEPLTPAQVPQSSRLGAGTIDNLGSTHRIDGERSVPVRPPLYTQGLQKFQTISFAAPQQPAPQQPTQVAPSSLMLRRNTQSTTLLPVQSSNLLTSTPLDQPKSPGLPLISPHRVLQDQSKANLAQQPALLQNYVAKPRLSMPVSRRQSPVKQSSRIISPNTQFAQLHTISDTVSEAAEALQKLKTKVSNLDKKLSAQADLKSISSSQDLSDNPGSLLTPNRSRTHSSIPTMPKLGSTLESNKLVSPQPVRKLRIKKTPLSSEKNIGLIEMESHRMPKKAMPTCGTPSFIAQTPGHSFVKAVYEIQVNSARSSNLAAQTCHRCLLYQKEVTSLKDIVKELREAVAAADAKHNSISGSSPSKQIYTESAKAKEALPLKAFSTIGHMNNQLSSSGPASGEALPPSVLSNKEVAADQAGSYKEAYDQQQENQQNKPVDLPQVPSANPPKQQPRISIEIAEEPKIVKPAGEVAKAKVEEKPKPALGLQLFAAVKKKDATKPKAPLALEEGEQVVKSEPSEKQTATTASATQEGIPGSKVKVDNKPKPALGLQLLSAIKTKESVVPSQEVKKPALELATQPPSGQDKGEAPKVEEKPKPALGLQLFAAVKKKDSSAALQPPSAPPEEKKVEPEPRTEEKPKPALGLQLFAAINKKEVTQAPPQATDAKKSNPEPEPSSSVQTIPPTTQINKPALGGPLDLKAAVSLLAAAPLPKKEDSAAAQLQAPEPGINKTGVSNPSEQAPSKGSSKLELMLQLKKTEKPEESSRINDSFGIDITKLDQAQKAQDGAADNSSLFKPPEYKQKLVGLPIVTNAEVKESPKQEPKKLNLLEQLAALTQKKQEAEGEDGGENKPKSNPFKLFDVKAMLKTKLQQAMTVKKAEVKSDLDKYLEEMKKIDDIMNDRITAKDLDENGQPKEEKKQIKSPGGHLTLPVSPPLGGSSPKDGASSQGEQISARSKGSARPEGEEGEPVAKISKEQASQEAKQQLRNRQLKLTMRGVGDRIAQKIKFQQQLLKSMN